MSAPPSKGLSSLTTVAKVVGAIVWIICMTFFRPISWLLALLFVGLSCGACVSDLGVWPAVLCFAAMVGQHLLWLIPLDSIERPLGLHKRK